ncbi:hypothetical protein Tco_0393375 [Tanacetum coccineum]
MKQIKFKKAVAHKFREYDQKLEAPTNFNIFEAFEKEVQAKDLTEIKKLLPTHIPNAIANYVRPRLNTSMLEVVKTNQINLFTQSSTSTDDLSDMDLKIKLLNRIHSNKSNETYTTHQKLYDTLFESITLENMHLMLKLNSHPFTKGLMIIRILLIIVRGRTRRNIKRMSVNVLLDHQELEYHVFQLKAAVISEARWNSDEGDISKPKSFERHMSKSTKPHPCFKNNDYTYLVDLSTEEKYTTFITKHYIVRYYKEEDRIDFFKAGMSAITKGNVYLDLRIKSVVHVVVKKKWGYGFLTSIVIRRSDDKEYEFSYADLPRLSVNDKNRDQEQGRRYLAWSEKPQKNSQPYQTYNVRQRNRPKDTFKMTAMHKRVVYLSQYNIKSLMKLSEVKKFCDGTLIKIQENLIDMLSKNKLGSGNKRLKGRDLTDYDVKSSKEMLKNIDEIFRHKEQLKRLEELVNVKIVVVFSEGDDWFQSGGGWISMVVGGGRISMVVGGGDLV